MRWKKKAARVPIWAKLSAPIVEASPTVKRSVRWKLVFILVACCGALILGGIALFRRVNWSHFAERVTSLNWSWSPPLLPSLVLVGAVVILLLWKLPPWQVSHSKGLTDEK